MQKVGKQAEIFTICEQLYNIPVLFVGSMMLYPAGIASVCSGTEIKLECTISGRVAEWTVTKQNETIISRPLSTTSGTSHFHGNNVTFTFSIESISPPTYSISISPTDTKLNGTEVSCRDREENTSLSTVITVLNEDRFLSRL